MKKINNYGCGKAIEPGDTVVNRWGRVFCLECDEKYPAPFMAVYTIGTINCPATCGASLNKIWKSLQSLENAMEDQDEQSN